MAVQAVENKPDIMQAPTYQLLEVANGKPIKIWTEGVPVENEASSS